MTAKRSNHLRKSVKLRVMYLVIEAISHPDTTNPEFGACIEILRNVLQSPFFCNLILSSSRRQITGESTEGRFFFLIIQEDLKV